VSVAPATAPASANPPAEVRKWFDTRKTYRAKMPALGTIGAALVVLNRLLTEDFSLAEKDHVAESRGQIKGLNKGAAARILAQYGETREFPEEGGRTNRGNIVAVAELLEALREAGLEQMPEQQRRLAVQDSIRFLVEKVGEWHNRQRLKPKFDPAKTTTVFLESILKEARERRTEGDVAQHLVGAALKLRHPNAHIPNQRVSAADQQTKRAADFTVGDTMFHVTTSPSVLLIDKCARTVDAGGRPVILTRDRDRVASARALAEDKGIVEKLTIRTVSAFVADIVDELGEYSQSSIKATLRALVELYNKNVDEVEIDKSMLIELPANL
jgi:hypothetical protein